MATVRPNLIILHPVWLCELGGGVGEAEVARGVAVEQ
jgi:hypothetical protein